MKYRTKENLTLVSLVGTQKLLSVSLEGTVG